MLTDKPMYDVRAGAYVTEINGLRAIACGLVLWHHIWEYNGTTVLGRFFSWTADVGWSGVAIFFGISGFLITGILVDSKNKNDGYWKKFYFRRALRIFPIYYACLLAVLAVIFVNWLLGLNINDPELDHPERFWVNFLYLTNVAMFVEGFSWPPYTLTWSLAVEEHFYLVFPVIVFFVSVRSLRSVLLGIVAVAILFRIWALFYDPQAVTTARTFTLSRMDGLAIGGLGALLVRSSVNLQRIPFLLACFTAWGLSLASLYFFNRSDPIYLVLGYTLLPLATVLTIIAMVNWPFPVLSKILNSWPLRSLGVISYGVYLIHVLIRGAYDVFPLHTHLPFVLTDLETATVRALSITLVTLLVSGLSWHYFEKPLLAFKDRVK